MKLTYEKCGDYLIPNLIPNPEPEGELRKFGLMRKYTWKTIGGAFIRDCCYLAD